MSAAAQRRVERRDHSRVANLPNDIAEQAKAVKARVDLVALIGRDVTLVPKQRLFVGVCPFHNEKTGSFTVYPRDRGEDGHFHCFGCGAHGDAIGWVMRVKGLGFKEAVEFLGGERTTEAQRHGGGGARGRLGDLGASVVNSSSSGAIGDQRRREQQRQDETNRILAAGRIWEEARPVTPGDPVDRYLAGRGIALFDVDSLAPARRELRCHSALGWRWNAGQRRFEATFPGLVARVVNVNGAFVGVHRIWLAIDGGRVAKAPVDAPKKSLGMVNGGAIRLFPPRDAGPCEEIGLAEGIEDALSAHLLSGLPVWSCIDGGKLMRVRLPFAIGRVTIFADRDKPSERHAEGVGMHDARMLAMRLRAEAVETRILLPRGDGLKDFNDELQRRQPAAAQ